MSRSFYVDCPCCKALLEVDAETGHVIKKWTASERNRPGEDKMTAALKKIEEDKKKREGLFDKTKSGLEEHKKKMDEVFQQQVEKVKKEGVKENPLRPFDLD
jgi:hypothetical protein